MLLFVFSSKNLNFFLFPCGGRRVFFHDWRNSETDVFVFQSLDRNSLFVVGFFFFVFEREIMWSSEKNTSVCYFSHDSVCVFVGWLRKNKIFFFSVFAIFSRLLLSLNPCAASRPAKRKNLFVKQTKLNLTWSPDRSFFTIHHNQFCIVFAFRVCCRFLDSYFSFS